MFWFERKAEEVEDQKEFIVSVLHKFVRAEPWEGGDLLGDYIAKIENEEVKNKFLDAVESLLQSKNTENWIKEELEITKKALKDKEQEKPVVIIYKSSSAGSTR